MNTVFVNQLKRMWGLGFTMFLLRLYQNTFDFDPDTGRHFPSVVGIALAILVVAVGVALFLISRGESRRALCFTDQFAVPDRSTILFVSAALLFAAGGAGLGAHAILTGAGIAPLVTAFFAVASFVGFLALIRQMRTASASSVAPVLPVMIFCSFWVLTLYLPSANDPILARYYLSILAAGVSAYAFAQLSGFFLGETRLRTFCFAAEYAVILDIAAVAELDQHSPLFAACALMLTAFLMLRKAKPGRVHTEEPIPKQAADSENH